MIRCNPSIVGSDRIDIEFFCADGIEKFLTLKIFDLESNFKLVEYSFNMVDYMNIWNTLSYNFNSYNFVNGFRIIVTNDVTKEIEYNDILLVKSYTKTKFIDKDNILTHNIIESLNNNFLESFRTFEGDSLGIKNDSVLVDLGSTVGVFTAYALDQNPNLRSICVEMNPSFHKVCVDTFIGNANITPINAAIYKSSGDVIPIRSTKEDLYDLGNTIVENLFSDQVHNLNVNTISLDDIMKIYNIERISFLKVDIEGYEYELFENLSDEILNKIDKIFLEFHHVHDPNRRLNLINRLMISGFKMKVYDENVNFYSTQMFSLFFSK